MRAERSAGRSLVKMIPLIAKNSEISTVSPIRIRKLVWTVTGHTSFLILIGLTVEISPFFAINGIIFTKLLPADRSARILGLPNRWAVAIGLSLVSVGVELLLHADGVFHWYYWWWNVASFPA